MTFGRGLDIPRPSFFLVDSGLHLLCTLGTIDDGCFFLSKPSQNLCSYPLARCYFTF
jgi:hypothetical protein